MILFSFTHVLRQQNVYVCPRKGYKRAYSQTCQKICTKRSQGDRDSWKNWSRGSDFHASVTPNAKGMQMTDCKLYVIPPDTLQCACRAEQGLASNKKNPNDQTQKSPKTTQINNKTKQKKHKLQKWCYYKLKYLSLTLITVTSAFSCTKDNVKIKQWIPSTSF